MKTNLNVLKPVSFFVAVLAMSLFSACSNDDVIDDKGEETDKVEYIGGIATSTGILFEDGTQIGNGDSEFVFTGKKTLKKGTYLLKGWVYVTEGAELTIEAGTIIKGDKQTMAALIIERGGKCFAEGTAGSPIVFTSEQPKGQRKPGDWGGLIVCGKANNNQGNDVQIEGGPRTKHGGSNDDDNSGVFRYIRVEFAGYPFQTDKEINGITFGSVGRGTTVDHLQVSYSNDDSYEWFGGTVNCKYLVAYNGWDDEFDTDFGFSGHVQFCLSIRDPRIADTSQSNGFESDNDANGTITSPYTSPIFSNVTFIGPMTAKNLATGFVNDAAYITGGDMYPDNGSKLGKFQSAMQIRRSSKLNCYNSVAVGYPIGLIIDGEKGATVTSAKNGELHLKNLVFAGMGVLGSDNNKVYKDELYDKATDSYDATQPSFSHSFFLGEGNKEMAEADLLLTDPKSTGQNYAPGTGSPLLAGGSFDGVTSSYLDKTVTYIGAFKASDNWLDSWTNFDPQNTDY